MLPGIGLWAVLCLAGAFYGIWLGFGGRGFGVSLAAFSLFFGIEILLACGNTQERLANSLGVGGGFLLSVLVLLVYLIYARETGAFSWKHAAMATAFVLAPVALAALRERGAAPGWQDYAAVLALFLPFKARMLAPLWAYPEGRLSYILAILMALDVGIAAFLLVRKLDGVGYSIVWAKSWAFTVMLSFVLFGAIAIPLGLALGFIRFGPDWAHGKTLPPFALGVLFFTAWPEEFLFRGILQNLLSKSLKNEWRGLAVASILFGAAHLPNGVNFPHTVNWRYGILAAIAGGFYGWTWKKTGSIFPAALLHAAVDISWHFFFPTV